jgi:hypothetical protein
MHRTNAVQNTRDQSEENALEPIDPCWNSAAVVFAWRLWPKQRRSGTGSGILRRGGEAQPLEPPFAGPDKFGESDRSACGQAKRVGKGQPLEVSHAGMAC